MWRDEATKRLGTPEQQQRTSSDDRRRVVTTNDGEGTRDVDVTEIRQRAIRAAAVLTDQSSEALKLQWIQVVPGGIRNLDRREVPRTPIDFSCEHVGSLHGDARRAAVAANSAPDVLAVRRSDGP